METVCKASLIGWDTSGDTILIEGWMTFNEPANARHAMGIVSQLSEIDSTPLKRKRFDEVMDCIAKKKLFNERGAGGELHTLCKRFQDRLLTVSPPETETETGDGEGYGEGDREGDLDLKSRARARDAAATLTGAALAIVKPDPTQEPPNPSPLLQTNYLKRAKLKGGNDL
jgi:hypothetical protein